MATTKSPSKGKGRKLIRDAFGTAENEGQSPLWHFQGVRRELLRKPLTYVNEEGGVTGHRDERGKVTRVTYDAPSNTIWCRVAFVSRRHKRSRWLPNTVL